ncbi:hypothetical protein E1A91_A05G359000v1, partial [Gossypium mustelinum]
NLPWMLCGDFNKIMYYFEKKKGLPRDKRRIELFQTVLKECQLVDVGYSRPWFTWEKENLPETNIRERLDRGMANDGMMTLFPNMRVLHLP